MDTSKFQEKQYKRRNGAGFEVVGSVTGDDLNDLLQMATETLRKSGTCKYEPDDAGLQRFKDKSIEYLDFLREQNNNGGSLTPTVESWCAYLGISRVTLMHYEHRSEDWRTFIAYMKNVLMACKTELASKGKMPPIVFVFDATNNGAEYFNTSEFKLRKAPDTIEDRPMIESADVIAEKYRARLADLQENDGNN